MGMPTTDEIFNDAYMCVCQYNLSLANARVLPFYRYQSRNKKNVFSAI
jgi:hypothetical protein